MDCNYTGDDRDSTDSNQGTTLQDAASIAAISTWGRSEGRHGVGEEYPVMREPERPGRPHIYKGVNDEN